MHRTKSTYLHPSGNPITAKYIIVGLQPDRASIMNNRPFYGSDGMELDDNLHKANISRSDCYFTYLIKDVDRPIGFYIKTNKKQSTITGYTITPEGQEYVNLLAEELSKCNSNVILTLGNIPLFVLADRLNINKWHGSVILPTLVSGKNLVPCLDPASIIPPNYNYKNKRLLIFDLKRAKQVACGEWAVIPRQYTIRPSFDLCMQFLKTCRMFGRLGNIIWYDIEVDIFNGEMTCISFAYTPTDGISIPFTYERGDYFTIPQEIEILLEIARLLEDDKISIGGQNLAFDSTYMLRKYGICVTHMEDTMVAQKTLLPDYSVGLDFICRHYTDIPYYKEDGKYWLKGIGTFDMGWNYNITDSLVCAEAHPKQVRDLMAQGNYTTYLRKIKSIPPYVYIMEHGIKINLESMSAAYDQMQQQSTIILKELERVAGQPLNPNSPKQIASYFYDVKRLPAYKSKSGGRSTDEKALKRISRKGYKEAKLILKYRHLIKASSTFLNPSKVDKDSRMRCSYNPVGTRYARASSSENIFGTGNNLQNQPHHVLTHFEADPDYVFYGLDLSQAENRIVAYEGRIFHMIECFETGQDVHALTARIILAVIYGPDVAMTKSIKELAPIGDGTKTWRDWGKKANHGLNYGQTFKPFSLQNEIPERDGKLIVETYHKGYTGIRNGYHAYVKKCLSNNRTLKNLMGRTTLFTDKISDQLYNEAYACIPQGTVGDIIDQRGLSYVYYNTSPLFKHVELMIQVHDQIGFQIPTPSHPTHPVPWEDHSKILEMVKNSLETPLYTHYKKKFIIPVDIMMGKCLNKALGKDLKSIDPRTLENTWNSVSYNTMLNSYLTMQEIKNA